MRSRRRTPRGGTGPRARHSSGPRPRAVPTCAERRDDLAHTLTLDQGKPLHSEAHDEVGELEEYWRMAAADATRLEGLMPPSIDAGKRVLVYRVPRGVVGTSRRGTGRTRCRRSSSRPRSPRGTRSSGRRRLDVALRDQARRVHRRRGAARRASSTSLPARVASSATRSSPTRARTRSGSSAPRRPGTRSPSARAGKTLLLEMGGNGPLVVLDDADVDKAVEASVTASFLCAGQSCTAGELFLVHEAVHDEFLDKLARRRRRGHRSGTPSTRRR